jgi:hypothetical protein
MDTKDPYSQEPIDWEEKPTGEEAEVIRFGAQNRFDRWAKRMEPRIEAFADYAKYMSENSKQWGAKPGLNSGNGQAEAILPLELFIALSKPGGPYEHDPEWWKDDDKFYKFLRAHKHHDERPGKHSS